MTLADRIESLRARSQRVRDVGEWDAIIADVRELHESLAEIAAMLAEWHAQFPDDVGDKEGPAMQRAVSILTKTKGQP